MSVDTLHDATTRYRLRDKNMDNREIAKSLGVRYGEFNEGEPPGCFFSFGDAIIIVAIRTEIDELAIFNRRPWMQKMVLGTIGDLIE